jgi:hypothetical protein
MPSRLMTPAVKTLRWEAGLERTHHKVGFLFVGRSASSV